MYSVTWSSAGAYRELADRAQELKRVGPLLQRESEHCCRCVGIYFREGKAAENFRVRRWSKAGRTVSGLRSAVEVSRKYEE